MQSIREKANNSLTTHLEELKVIFNPNKITSSETSINEWRSSIHHHLAPIGGHDTWHGGIPYHCMQPKLSINATSQEVPNSTK